MTIQKYQPWLALPPNSPKLVKLEQSSVEEPALPGITYDHETKYTATYLPTLSAKEQEKFDFNLNTYHRQIPLLDADRSINTIDKQLAKLDKVIARQRPTLDKNTWDVTVKDGKLKVTGSASTDDKAWLEKKLGTDKVLADAVGQYVKAAVDYLETTDENPAYYMQAGRLYSGSQVYNFKDVAKQLDGVIAFRELSANSWKNYLNPHTGKYDNPGSYRGGDTFEILAKGLKVEESEIG